MTRSQYIPQITERDSLWIIQKVRDTIVKIEADSSTIRALLECDSLGQVNIKRILQYENGNSIIISDLSVKKNILTTKSNTPEKSFVFKLNDTERLQIKTTTIIPPPIEINSLTLWQKIRLRIAEASIGAILIFLFFKLC